MLTPKELTYIITISIIFAFTLTLMESLEIFAYTLLASFLVITLNILIKKVVAFYFDTEIKTKFWEIKYLGLWSIIWKLGRSHPSRKLKHPFPAGIFIPIITTAFTFGNITWLASLTFEIKQKIYHTAKRHRLYSFPEIPEFHIALIAAAGIFINLTFAVIGYLINFPEFSKINLYYAFFNMIPLSNLDGNKIFFGSKLLWSFLGIITLIGIVFSFTIL